MIESALLPRLEAWAEARRDGAAAGPRPACRDHLRLDGRAWNEELVLQRYELLYEAGLIPEALRGGPPGIVARLAPRSAVHGRPMILDHRRILATGIARLRAKIKYHPVVFELMPETFTLLQLQRCVEALAGRLVHKQNFRRLIEQQELVEETGETSPGYRRASGQAVPVPPRGPGRARHRRNQAADLEGLTNLMLNTSIWA